MRVTVAAIRGLSGTATVLQSGWRMRQAIKKSYSIKVGAAVLVIQRMYRLWQGRRFRRFRKACRGSAVRRIVTWIRRQRLLRQVRTTWRFIRHNVRTILDNNTLMRIERGWDGRHSIPEARRLFHSSMASFWHPVLVQLGASGLRVQRCRVVRLYDDFSKVIRKAFLKYSTDGVSSPEKVFRLSRGQFAKFCAEMGFMELLKESNFNLEKAPSTHPPSTLPSLTEEVVISVFACFCGRNSHKLQGGWNGTRRSSILSSQRL